MQNYFSFPQPNNYVVNPVVHNWQLGFIADGKYCIVRNSSFLMKKLI